MKFWRSCSARLEPVFDDAATIVAVWATLLLVETTALGFLWREQFSGAWELALARRTLVPFGVAALAPLSPLVVACWRTVRKAAAGQFAAGAVLAVLCGIGSAAMSISISGGRHFTSFALRVPFVFVMTILGAFLGALVLPRIVALERRPVGLALAGLFITISAWVTDAAVLPRLYPGFHAAMLAGSLGGSALVGIAMRSGLWPDGAGHVPAAIVATAVIVCAGWAPQAVRKLDSAANLRIALVEHAPLLGRAVALAAHLRPLMIGKGTLDVERPSAATPSGPSEVARSLDWTGHDLVLITVDALRADHVSAYGYGRLTTPNIDALAREGTLFESAYCPTPNTSYSVTSMLTGKYLRALFALGLGEYSETWPQALRRYGWRTAAFYPPAVFFVDESRFARFESNRLGFEYAKVEFTDAALREKQVAEYLDSAANEARLFLWMHFFEPHEPYVIHPDHRFDHGVSADMDAYDGEVAAADDSIGAVIRLVRSRRRDPVVLLTADHGEEFGEHGGRFHGTTVYEEQVRVPMIVAGPGVREAGHVASVVQTIDLLPTVLSALGVPRPARLRGRDLGPLLAGSTSPKDEGFAFAETDDYALVASGDERLVCERRAAACSMYVPKEDPQEHRDVSGQRIERWNTLRAMLRATEQDHGRYEQSGGAAWPQALRRGLQGEVDAALDVASLLDDADVALRRKAAEICFRLHAPITASALRRAFARDEDEEVRRWSALALARIGEPLPSLVQALLKEPSADWRRRAALVLAERGHGAACDELVAWWADVVSRQAQTSGKEGEPPRLDMELGATKELLLATASAHCRGAVPALVRALDDVRARPFVADALGVIADDRARAPLLALFGAEAYPFAQAHEARALLALGAYDWSSVGEPDHETHLSLRVPAHAGSLVLLVLLSDASASVEASANGTALTPPPLGTEVRTLELAPVLNELSRKIQLDLRASTGGARAVWLVPGPD